MNTRTVEILVGFFILAGIAAIIFLALRVSGLTPLGQESFYSVSAEFDNIGGLKIRAPVAISGVKVGEVSNISLEKNSFRAKVTMHLYHQFDDIPVDTSASIFTQGILGANYVSLTPGFETASLNEGSRIETTHPALILENLIGQLVYSLKSDNSSNKGSTKSETSTPNHG